MQNEVNQDIAGPISDILSEGAEAARRYRVATKYQFVPLPFV